MRDHLGELITTLSAVLLTSGLVLIYRAVRGMLRGVAS